MNTETETVYTPNEIDRHRLADALFYEIPVDRIAERLDCPMRELRVFYPDVFEEYKLRRGRRNTFVPTQAMRALVRRMTAMDMPCADIAAFLGCCHTTVRKHFSDELRSGAAVSRLHVDVQPDLKVEHAGEVWTVSEDGMVQVKGASVAIAEDRPSDDEPVETSQATSQQEGATVRLPFTQRLLAFGRSLAFMG